MLAILALVATSVSLISVPSVEAGLIPDFSKIWDFKTPPPNNKVFPSPSPVLDESKYAWQEPDLQTQSRSPCPMLNTLANHGMLPRDGKNISADHFADVLKAHLNLQWDFWWTVAQTTIDVVKPGAEAIDLHDIKLHNGIQHDAALTRNDMGYGQYYTRVNHTLVDQLGNLSTNGFISYDEMAYARLLREKQSKAWNPHYTLPGRWELDIKQNKWFLAIDQAAVPLLVLSDPVLDEKTQTMKQNGKVPVERLKYFFNNERLPFDFGWAPSQFELTRGHIFDGIWKVFGSYFKQARSPIVSPIGLTSGPEPNPNQEY